MLANQIIGSASVTGSISRIAQRSLARSQRDQGERARHDGRFAICLAQNAADMEKALAYVQARDGSIARFATEALKISRIPENRERIEKIKKLSVSYVAIAKDMGVAKSELFALVAKRQENGDAWRKQLATANNALDASKSPKAHEFERSLTAATATFDDSRTAGWRYGATGESAQITRSAGSADKALAQLQKLRSDADDKAFAGAVDGLVAVVTDSKTIIAAMFSRTNRSSRWCARRACRRRPKWASFLTRSWPRRSIRPRPQTPMPRQQRRVSSGSVWAPALLWFSC